MTTDTQVEVPTTNDILAQVATAMICQQIDNVASELGDYQRWGSGRYYLDTALILKTDFYVYDTGGSCRKYKAEIRQPFFDAPRTEVWDVEIVERRGYHATISITRPGAWLSHLSSLNEAAERRMQREAEKQAQFSEQRFAPVDDAALFADPPQPIEEKQDEPTLAERLLSILREVAETA